MEYMEMFGNKKAHATAVLFCLTCISMLITPLPTHGVGLFSEGGPILFATPCISQFGPGFFTVTLSYKGIPTPKNIIYPYIPGLVTKASFLPATQGFTTLGLTTHVGGCFQPPHNTITAPQASCMVSLRHHNQVQVA